MRILNLMNGQKIDFNSVSLTNSTPITLEIFDITHKDLEVISEKFNIDLIDLEDVFDINERPRVDIDPVNAPTDALRALCGLGADLLPLQASLISLNPPPTNVRLVGDWSSVTLEWNPCTSS